LITLAQRHNRNCAYLAAMYSHLLGPISLQWLYRYRRSDSSQNSYIMESRFTSATHVHDIILCLALCVGKWHHVPHTHAWTNPTQHTTISLSHQSRDVAWSYGSTQTTACNSYYQRTV